MGDYGLPKIPKLEKVHYHLGTTCCGGVESDCIHAQQVDQDSEETIWEECEQEHCNHDACILHAYILHRIQHGLMDIESFECRGDIEYGE